MPIVKHGVWQESDRGYVRLMKKAAVLVVICLMLAVIPAGCGKSEKIITQLDDASEAKIGVMTGSTGEQ